MGYIHQSQRVFTPLSQARIANIEVVRLKKGGCRFEVGCHKNKVIEWRSGVETNLTEVLQSESIYENVSRGKRASNEDMQRVFGTIDFNEVAKVIVEKGDLQVADGERATTNESVLKEIAAVVAEKCVNPDSNRPYPVATIERLMKEIHYTLVQTRSTKQQAMDVIKKLEKIVPITRAKMKVQVTISSHDASALTALLVDVSAVVLEHKDDSGFLKHICLIEPGAYRRLDAFVHEDAACRHVDVIELSHHEEGEHSIDEELSTSLAIVGPPPVPAAAPPAKPKGRPCSTCGGHFTDTAQYREHFRSEWHRYNLKMKAKSLAVIDEDAFFSLDASEIKQVFESLD
ncbi:Aste57867_19970 [Aphanomyces stellatus]|uniref:Aste57867_19970 protein n=1 Tax=Aphanomyces stellatus TaxID=120398 RepID=A0A485LEG6_9STRA|nr:hypothetical protein As57867_019904 [Aphanomyces stellatus]VFT96667.1 Aste57867_19970 [Aphanomyces stellatus]